MRPIASRRSLPVLIAVSAASALTLAAPAPAASAAAFRGTCSAPPAAAVSFHDIDRDVHREGDLAIGVPRSASGYVDLTLDPQCAPHRQRVSQRFFAGLPAPGASDGFGSSVAYVHPGGAESAGLVIGAPGSNGGRGAVVIARGGGSGLSRTGAVRITGRTAGEHFGAAVAVSGQRVFVAAPDRTVSGHRSAGAVDEYAFKADGTAGFVTSFSQATAGVPGAAEPGDRFGSRLAAYGADLFVGDPDEAIGSIRDAGTVTVLRLRAATGTLAGARMLSLAGSWPGTPAAGDRFGAAVATPDTGAEYVVIGIPGKDVGRHGAAGAVQIVRATTSTLSGLAVSRTVTQDSTGVPGVAETGDRFGTSAAVTGWASCGRGPAVAVGAPGEDVGSVRDAGSVTIVGADSAQASAPCRRIWSKGSSGGLGGRAHAGERVGAAVGTVQPRWDGADIDFPGPTAPGFVLGVPGQDLGAATDAGAAFVLVPFGTTRQLILHDSAGAKRGEQYGGVRTG